MSKRVSLSVLIPNYNYAGYIGETIESVLAQAPDDLEIAVADNASTDNSVDVVRQVDDPRICLSVNACNVGFAANLERVASMARGRRMLLLSSDDRMREGALDAYSRLEAALGDRADHAIWGSTSKLVDSDGLAIGELEADEKLWREATVDEQLSRAVGHTVRGIAADRMLKRCLELLRTPLPFATTCYSKMLHDAVGGYSGGRLMNPDKWFLWKLLSVADMIYIVDHPLFDYRVHNSGQNSLEQRSGALKHLTDQYTATFNLPDSVLEKGNLSREVLERAFIEQDIALRGLACVADGKRRTAWRGIQFGRAAYPDAVRSNPKVWLLRGLLLLGPGGTALARLARARVQKLWQARESAAPDREPK